MGRNALRFFVPIAKFDGKVRRKVRPDFSFFNRRALAITASAFGFALKALSVRLCDDWGEPPTVELVQELARAM